METVALLLMAYGSPDSLDELEPYLLDIRGGRPTSTHLVEEIKERYALIGGRSPLLDLTRQQAQALEVEMNRRFAGQPVRFKAYLGMRHWQPRIQQAVEEMSADGIHKVIALVMAPHSSRLSTGAYFARLEEAIQACGAQFEVQHIENWHDHPGLIAAIAEKAQAALEKFAGEQPYIIFTAHSLPERILAQGDPYDQQLNETARLLAKRLELPEGRWRFCYQSAGQSGPEGLEKWLGPAIEEVVLQLVQAGEGNLLVVPIGFVCDHVEVLYDLDIACRRIAQEHGARLERSASLNASPTFIAALADIASRDAEFCVSTPEPAN